MDSGKLPPYRSSYLLRFHPYPRVKPSARERVMASTWEDGSYDPLQMNSLGPENDISFNKTIHGTDIHDEIQLRQRRLSMASLIVDLAPLFARCLNLSFKDD